MHAQEKRSIITFIQEFERTQKKICRHKMSIMFNEICIYIFFFLCNTMTKWFAKSEYYFKIYQIKSIKTNPSVLDMILNNQIARPQPWRFGEWVVALHCHCSQVHSKPEWKHLIGSYLWPEFNKLFSNKWLMLNYDYHIAILDTI